MRTWAVENDEIYITTGPVLKGQLPTIGPNGVGVPHFYYKVVLDNHKPELKAITFVMRNAPSKQPLGAFAVTVDSVERLTGLNIHHDLPDALVEQLESSIGLSLWSFKVVQYKLRGNKSSSVRCKGVAQAGAQC